MFLKILSGKSRVVFNTGLFQEAPMRGFLTLAAVTVLSLSHSAVAGLINVPDSVLEIGDAVVIANPGDTILVATGTYAGGFGIYQNIVLKAAGPGPVIIQGIGSAWVFVIGDAAIDNSCIVEGFVIENGGGSVGGGIYISQGSPTIRNNIIRNNHVTGFGGGISVGALSSASAVISGNTIQNNSASAGGGVYLSGAGSRLLNNTISNNAADTAGGGVLVAGGNAVISGNLFSNNESMLGGAISSQATTAIINGNRFVSNTALQGGAIHTRASDSIRNCELMLNSAEARVSWGDSARGGAIFADAFFVNPVIENCQINSNTSDSIGGGICARSNGSITINNSTITGNDATFSGGGVHAWISDFTVTAGSVTGNTAASNPQMEVITFLAAQAVSSVTYSNIEGGWFGTGNIDVAPLYRDAPGGDFHLQSTACGDAFDSPLIDAGNPAASDALLDCQHGLGTIRSDIGAFGGSNLGVPTGVTDGGHAEVLPKDFRLGQNFPNPFNPSTTISFKLGAPSMVTISIFNILGRHEITIVEQVKAAGVHTINWDGKDRLGRPLASGVYLYRLETDGRSESRKMLLLR
jgi:hypothetical protein